MPRAIRLASLLAVVLLPLALPAAPAHAQRINGTIETLEADLPVFGLFTADFSLANARALSGSELDFIFIDMEHSPLDLETLRSFLLGMTNKARIAETGSVRMDVTPLVRIPQYGPEQLQFIVKQVLDLGAYGIVFPFINTRADAEAAVTSMRYPPRRDDPQPEPRGTRGSSPGNAIWYWGVSDYTQRADTWPLDPDGELLAVLQIESREGVENIDEILSVGGIGAIFVGPADLSNSYGVPGDHPDVTQAIATVLDACQQNDVPCGITTSAGSVVQRLDEGFDFVTIGYWNDAGISTGPGEALQIGREHAGRAPGG
jgi:4-hydroxy-2-oxoheptanedioate aldolase